MLENKRATDKETVERELNHVLDMGKMFLENYAYSTSTERMGLLLAMTAAVRQLESIINKMGAYLRNDILDPYHLNYIDYARSIENLVKIWREELGVTPIAYTFDDMQVDEDECYFNDVSMLLMKNARPMSEIIEKGLVVIADSLRGIVDYYHRLTNDVELQNKKFHKLENHYEAAMWAKDKVRLIYAAKEYVSTCRCENVQESYQHFLNKLSLDATDYHMNKLLTELNETYLNGESPATFIVNNRNQLSFEDIAQHFCFVKSHRMISTHIEMYDLWSPADEEYKDLFVNRAAQELAFLLAPTIGMYVDFRHNYQYAALQMAMMDLGMIYNELRNGVQMMRFVNECFLKEDAIKDQTTLTQWTAKLLGRRYGVIDEDNFTETNMSLQDFRKMKDYYWHCLSIINKVLKVDIQEMGFASYLLIEHANTPAITDYMNKGGENVMERLFVLKSAFHKESVFL